MRIWFKRKNKSEDSTVAPEEKVILHGHDLSKWNYLGYTRCSYVDSDGNTTSTYPIFLFVSKKNEKRRSYTIAGTSTDHVKKSHRYILETVDPWSAGEGEIWHLISGAGNKPSDYLKEYILDRFGSEWDSEANWWGSNDTAKYNSANNKQKRDRKKKETTHESNVVTVDFGKQA